MKTGSLPIAQQHLMPKADGALVQRPHVGSLHNRLDDKKISYIIKMRKDLCNDDICFKDGSLNLKYFNVKKGHYWSEKENDKLIQGVLKHGVLEFKKIRKEFFRDSQASETEIRLRICKLLKIYDLKLYSDRKFTCREEIEKEAIKNKKEA